jgi:hypothetical protein
MNGPAPNRRLLRRPTTDPRAAALSRACLHVQECDPFAVVSAANADPSDRVEVASNPPSDTTHDPGHHLVRDLAPLVLLSVCRQRICLRVAERERLPALHGGAEVEHRDGAAAVDVAERPARRAARGVRPPQHGRWNREAQRFTPAAAVF